jgi:prevent-host-death family protein
MKLVNIQAAKTHLSRLVEEAAGGTEIVLAKAGKPMVRLVPYSAPPKARTPGLLAGQGWEATDCWTAAEDLLGSSLAGPLFHGAVEEPPAGPCSGAASP